jgi:uncharacterized membrane protein YtjA (UPF0391 family)
MGFTAAGGPGKGLVFRSMELRLQQCIEPSQTSTFRGLGTMSLLKWALIFFLISVVAAVFGFTGISVASADVARVLFYIFVIIFLVLLVLGLTLFRA